MNANPNWTYFLLKLNWNANVLIFFVLKVDFIIDFFKLLFYICIVL